MTTSQPSAWELAADDVIAVLYAEPERWYDAYNVMGLRPALMPTIQHNKVFDAIGHCLKSGDPVHDTVILDKVGAAVSIEWLAQRIPLYDSTRTGDRFTANVKIVREHGLRAGTKTLLDTAAQELSKGAARDKVVNDLLKVLLALGQDNTIRRETAAEIGEDFLAFMHSTPPPVTRTGLQWLDGMTGGIERGHMWWIAAPYKHRKSTVMLNVVVGILLNWAINGCAPDAIPSIGLLSGEMPRRRIAAQVVAMLAVAWLKEQNLFDKVDRFGHPLNWISAKSLTDAQERYLTWDSHKVAAVQFGIKVWKDIFGKHLRVYDRSPTGGSLTDMNAVQNTILYDIQKHGGNIFPIDYLQIFAGDDATLFEHVSRSAIGLQRMSGEQNVTIMALAQQNEATVTGGGNNHSPGIKGGGDPAATADYLITSRYRWQETPVDDVIELTMKLSRHGEGGGNKREELAIHPKSGLMLDFDWIGKLGRIA